MKCPLMVIGVLLGKGRYDWAGTDCLKEECAWWNKTMEECNLVTIAIGLFDISTALSKIETKIPSVGS